jgi:DNA primase
VTDAEPRADGRTIADWVHENLAVHHEATNGRGEVELVCECFVCAGHQKLWINGTTGKWGCYRCGSADKLLTELVMQVLGWRFGKAMALARSLKPVRESRVALEAKLQAEDFSAPRMVEKPKGLRPAWAPLHWYLEDRGVTAESAERWQIHYCAFGRFGNRLLIPTLDRGVWIGFTGRAVDEHKKVKYLTEHQAGVVGVLGLDQAFLEEHVVVNEGPFDAIMTTQRGFVAVAAEGKSLTAEKMALMKAAGVKRVSIMFDSNDDEADWAAHRLCVRATDYFTDVGWCPLGGKTDPGDATPEQLAEAIAKRHFPTEREMKTAEAKARRSRERRLQKAIEEGRHEDQDARTARVHGLERQERVLGRVDHRRRP